MRKLSLLAAVAAVAGPAHASVFTVGSGYAESCYQAADVHDTSRAAIADCDLALAEQALTADDRVATFVNRGILHLNRKNLAAATADFDAALRLDPREAEAWLNKAIVTVRFGRSADAMPLVSKAIELGTRKPALAYFVRALVYEDSGNIAAAYRDLRRAQQLEPKWQEPANELRRFKVRQL